MIKVYQIQKLNSARGVWEIVSSGRFPKLTYCYNYFLASAVYANMLDDTNRGQIRFITIDLEEFRILDISTWGVVADYVPASRK